MIPTETPAARSTDVDIGIPLDPTKQTPGRKKIRSWLNQYFRIKLTDGRILIGLFLCTDADANIILGICTEYRDEEERTLGLVIVPKKHIVTIEVDKTQQYDPLEAI